jgi:putative hydrolase of the HAD superfamily
MAVRGLLVDFGGVLTGDVFASFERFCVAEGLPGGTVRDLFRHDPTGRELLAGLEDGTLAEPEFERRFAKLLNVQSAGLIERLLGGSEPDDAMLGAVREVRAKGAPTGLISNSWGAGMYDRDLLAELFDAVVISAEVGIRKPDPQMYRLGAEAIGLEPAECVYVDDIGGNLKPARALGMVTVLHRDAPTTIAALRELGLLREPGR